MLPGNVCSIRPPDPGARQAVSVRFFFSESMHNIVEQYRGTDGLDQKTVQPQLIRFLHDFFTAIGRYQDYRRGLIEFWIIYNLPRCFDTVHARHLPVHENQIEGFIFQTFFNFNQSFPARGGQCNIE